MDNTSGVSKSHFQTKAYLSAYLAGLSALAYAYFFILAKHVAFSSLFLMLSGLFALPVMVALFLKFRKTDEGIALLAVVLGFAGGVGTLVHAGYDLANTINPPPIINATLPSQIDPRGLLAFGITGIAILKFSWLIKQDKKWPLNLGNLGYLSGVLLVLIYLARLIVLSPTNPLLLYPVLIEGFIINPLWYLWLGTNLKG